jgi:DNA polymerase-1
MIEFDAAGQEFRWMAIASGDPVMLKMCQPGEDAHSYMGAQIEGIAYRTLMQRINEGDLLAKPIRKLGKLANLSLQYRTSARKLMTVARVQYDLPMELSQAQHIHETYLRTYVRVLPYWNTQIAQTKKQGYVETFAGRRVYVDGDWSGNFGWSMGSTAINYRIQGTGADQKYLALSVLRPYVEMKYLLDNLPYKKAWGFEPPIPLPWDCHVGKSWGEMK